MVKREEYAPYHTMPGFEVGIEDYNNNCLGWQQSCTDTKDAQAYDRGAEFAMRLAGE